jgi:hypothetical protein
VLRTLNGQNVREETSRQPKHNNDTRDQCRKEDQAQHELAHRVKAGDVISVGSLATGAEEMAERLCATRGEQCVC